jgi:hypothetical protein
MTPAAETRRHNALLLEVAGPILARHGYPLATSPIRWTTRRGCRVMQLLVHGELFLIPILVSHGRLVGHRLTVSLPTLLSAVDEVNAALSESELREVSDA